MLNKEMVALLNNFVGGNDTGFSKTFSPTMAFQCTGITRWHMALKEVSFTKLQDSLQARTTFTGVLRSTENTEPNNFDLINSSFQMFVN